MDRTALKGLSRTELEAARAMIDKELQACVICESEGAMLFVSRTSDKTLVGPNEGRLLLCQKCWTEKRLPGAHPKPV